MEEGAGRKVGSCFFRCRPTPCHGLLRRRHSSPPYFSLIFAATPAHTSRRHAGSARPLATAGAEPPKKAAAAGCGMLSDENGVPPHRRLPAVVGNKRRREPPTHETFGMTADDRHSPAFDTGHLFGPQTEPAAEIGLRQPREKRLERRCLHQILLTVFGPYRFTRRDKDNAERPLPDSGGGILFMLLRQIPLQCPVSEVRSAACYSSKFVQIRRRRTASSHATSVK